MPAGVFDRLQNTLLIRLDQNKLAVLPPGLFDKLGLSLIELYIGDNRLTDLPLGFFDMGNNRFEELNPGVFDSLESLQGLDLHNNHLQRIPNGAFHVLESVISIDISANNISHSIGEGTFANPDLAFVSLAHNAIRSIEAGAFGKSLEHVWLTGTNLTCAGLAGEDGALPSGAGCTDEGVCSAMWGVAALGDGWCDDAWEPLYNTAECQWDSGDCK